jgi:hypothetical protein
MRLRRVAMGSLVLGLMGVAVRAEGRAVGRVLLGMDDARMSGAVGAAVRRGRAEAAVLGAAGAPNQPAFGPGAEGTI